MKKILLALIAFSLTTPAWALKFSNQFVEFELPMKWNCVLEGAEWVCQSTDDQKKRDAIIVLAAKLKGEQDSLDKYQEYLAKPRSFTLPNSKPTTSQPKYAKVISINSQSWVDSIHMESEIPGFYTRYLATVKQDIGVLITYSINKNKYQDYLGQFEEMVKSLKVFRKAGAGINSNVQQSIFAAGAPPTSFTQGGVFAQASPAPGADKPAKKEEDDNSILLLILLGGGVAFYIIKKRRGRSGGGGNGMPS